MNFCVKSKREHGGRRQRKTERREREREGVNERNVIQMKDTVVRVRRFEQAVNRYRFNTLSFRKQFKL
jgi:hypothetical protein